VHTADDDGPNDAAPAMAVAAKVKDRKIFGVMEGMK
jgi:hypothetical protein